jgi:hypothetical protein
VVVGSRLSGAGSILERMLGTVLRDDICASPRLHVSWVVDYDFFGMSGFWLLLLSFIWDLLPIPMKSAPSMHALYLLLLFLTILSYIYIYIYYYFIYSVLLYLFHLVFRTHVLSCVRGGIVTSKLFLIILGCDTNYLKIVKKC